MNTLNEIPKKIDEAKSLLLKIIDDHMGADVRHERIRNNIAVIDLELKIHQINSMDTLSKTIQDGVESQGKQAKSLTFWTGIMAVAIVVQSLVLGVQVFLALQKIGGHTIGP